MSEKEEGISFYSRFYYKLLAQKAGCPVQIHKASPSAPCELQGCELKGCGASRRCSCWQLWWSTGTPASPPVACDLQVVLTEAM